MVFTAHLEIARLLLDLVPDWETKDVSTAGRGLARAGDGSLSPRPAVSEARITQIASEKGRGGADLLL